MEFKTQVATRHSLCALILNKESIIAVKPKSRITSPTTITTTPFQNGFISYFNN